MLRVTEIEEPQHKLRLKLEGRLVGQWVELLAEICATRKKQDQSITLDLGDLEYASKEGIALLAELRSQSVAWVSCPPSMLDLLSASHQGGR